ncbi:MAG: PKD domain-containing protein [Bacteroidales bacterium]|nr:PKD domain-containing protein [Bacteroidales bacterium]
MRTYIYFLVGMLLFLSAPTVFGQDQTSDKKGYINGVDTRVDNMSYWMDKAERGLVPFNPKIPVRQAIFKTSAISAPGVKTTNSPDIPTTSQTNVTESENSIFVDPNDFNYVLNSNNSTSWSGGSVGSLYGANYFQSADGGLNWGGSEQGAGGANSGDPTTAISHSGRQYVNFISDPGGQGIAYSDNGSSWTSVTVAPNPGSLADKNHMWIDNSLSSPYEGNLYVAWTPFGGSDDSEIVVSRSTNNGVSWSTATNVSSAVAAGSHNQGVNLQTGPNGEVYAAWAIYDGWPTDETAIGFAKSTNGGASWQTASRIITNIRGIRTTETSKNHRVNSFPVMAVDISGGPNNGNIYIVWSNVGTPGVNTGTNISVYMIRSTNGGSTWSSPIRVNQGPFADGKEAYFPWISCDPITGVLSTVFYDDRNTTSTSCEVFSAYSVDGGASWIDFQVSDVSFTPSAIPGLAGGYMGDYLGITSLGGKVYPCWTDNRNGLYLTYVSPYELGLNAEFSADATEICTGTSVDFTDLSTGEPISWNWSFPGGTPSSYNGQNPPAVTYNSPGTYNVSLTVSDGVDNDTETKTGYISVKNVIADFSGTPQTVVVGNSVTFTDMSSCNPTSWSWSFPGGTPSSFNGQNPPTIQYNTEGIYNVTLTVTKGAGNDVETKTDYIEVVPPEFNMQNGTITTCMGNFYDSGGPTGSYNNDEDYVLTFYPATAGAQLEFNFTQFNVEFQSTCNYDYLNIYNGENTSAPLIGQYCGTNSPGLFTSSNPAGAITFEWHSDISVTNTGWTATINCTTNAPVADFAASSTTPALGSDVQFTDLSASGPTAWNWTITPSSFTFINGTNANSQNPEVQFNQLGFYTVTLDVSNPYGSDSETKTNYIEVISCTYCTAGGTTGDEEWINNVTFNTINNPSDAATGYTDFTAISTDVMPGETHTISASCGSIGTWTENIWVFFDWNQDCDFDDANESYDLGETSGPGTLSNNITIPVDANEGTVRMRVMLKFSADPTSCEVYSYGETEDYTVNVTSGTRELDLKVFLEGPYNGTEMVPGLGTYLPLFQPFNQDPWYYSGSESVGSIPNSDIVEWVLIDVRDAATPAGAGSATSVEKHAAFVKNDGTVVDLDGSSNIPLSATISQNMYVVVWQRNHIGIMSNNALVASGGVYNYDFSSDVNQVYGGILGHKELSPGVWGMFSGDADRDGVVGTDDKSTIWQNNAGTDGYNFSDYNLDSQTDNADKNDFWVPNIGEGTQVPN